MDPNQTAKTGTEWPSRVNAQLRRHAGLLLGVREVPVGGMVLWGGGGTPPPGWLAANGSTFSAATYPLLQHRLGTTVLPAPVAVSGIEWVIRAI